MEENNNSPTELNNPNDKFVKGILSMKSIVRDCAEQFLPADILDDIDLSTLEKLPNILLTI